MQDEMTFNELVSSSVEDASDYLTIIHKHQKELEEKAEELAKEKAEELFNSQKEEYRLEVIKEINAAAVTAKRVEISRSSPYISETVTVNGKELHGCLFPIQQSTTHRMMVSSWYTTTIAMNGKFFRKMVGESLYQILLFWLL